MRFFPMAGLMAHADGCNASARGSKLMSLAVAAMSLPAVVSDTATVTVSPGLPSASPMSMWGILGVGVNDGVKVGVCVAVGVSVAVGVGVGVAELVLVAVSVGVEVGGSVGQPF